MSFKPTSEQEQIFTFFKNGNGHGMIDAVAGSGKTSTIVLGIDYIDKKSKILFTFGFGSFMNKNIEYV